MTGRRYIQICRELSLFDAERVLKVIKQKLELAAKRRWV